MFTFLQAVQKKLGSSGERLEAANFLQCTARGAPLSANLDWSFGTVGTLI